MTILETSIPGYVEIVSKTCSHFSNFNHIFRTFFKIFTPFLRNFYTYGRQEVSDISCKVCIKCSSASTSITHAVHRARLGHHAPAESAVARRLVGVLVSGSTVGKRSQRHPEEFSSSWVGCHLCKNNLFYFVFVVCPLPFQKRRV